jgi:glycosyltransferase involved in cell wall biosynthesis
VAKSGYVESHSGWFSDRSACYLASGRPVVAQATGFEEVLPAGEGLLQFSTVDEAVAAIEAVRAEPELHRRRARELAGERFDARTVLSRLLIELASSPPLPRSAAGPST